jgi:type I restriction enzyme S subunit
MAREAPAGNVAIIKNGEKVCLGQRTVLLRPDKAIVCPDFLVYYLLAPQQQYSLLGTANGATVAHVNIPVIKNLSVSMPPLEVQRKVAGILSAYDSLIETNQRQIKLLEEAAQRLYREWFVDLRFPGHEDVPVVDGVPEGWIRGELGDIAEESGKKEKKENRDEYSYYLPIDCLPSKSLAYITENDITLAESSLVAFVAGDILFGAMRPYFHKVVVARDKGLTRTTCFVLNAKQGVNWSYLLMLLFAKKTIEYATTISVGTTMPYVRWKDFSHMPTMIPSTGVSQAFNKIVTPIVKQICHLAMSCEQLSEARDRLLPKLMSGEISI